MLLIAKDSTLRQVSNALYGLRSAFPRESASDDGARAVLAALTRHVAARAPSPLGNEADEERPERRILVLRLGFRRTPTANAEEPDRNRRDASFFS